MKKWKKAMTKLIPSYAIVPLLACVAVNFGVYIGTDLITEKWRHYDLTLAVDRMIPVIPAFVIIYLGCYLFWIVNYILIVRQGKEHCMRFVTADILSRLVCAAVYLLLPTTNVRPHLVGTDVWTEALRMVYSMDAPTRLFPSIHCLVSWFCYIGIRGQKHVPKAYQYFSCLFALLVCVSTLVTKQHYVVDTFGGILLAEAMYYLAHHTELYRRFERVFERIRRIGAGRALRYVKGEQS